MGGYENFMKRMNAGGTTYRDEQIENARRLVEQTFADDPSYIVDGVRVWNTDRVLHPRIYEDRFRSTSPAQAKIQTRINEPFYLGDIIPWTDHGYWLCIHATNLHNIQYSGKLSYCNYHVHFKSPLTGEIIEMPVSTLNATQYGSGESERYDDKIKMRIGSSQMIMYMQYNEHSALIDSGFRFLMDRNYVEPTAYVVTQADMVSYSDAGEHGYIHFVIVEDQYNPKRDNKELMVADYYSDPIGTGEELVDNPDKWL